MIEHTAQQGSDEWLAARCGLATASKFSYILAKGRGSEEATVRRNYRSQLVVERLSGRPVNGYESPAMRQGTEREPLARLAYETATGNLVRQVGFIVDEMHQAGASLDGRIGSTGAIECKCPELSAHLDYLRLQSEPSIYTAQIQGQMWIAGLDWVDFVSWNPDFPAHLQLVIRRVERDEKYIAGLQLAVELFMAEVREEVAALQKVAPWTPV